MVDGVIPMRRVILALPVLVLAAFWLLILSQMYELFASKPPGVLPIPSTSPFCRSGDPMEGVYNPWRLGVVSPCITVTGVVTRVARMVDGDYHIDVRLDAPYANLINKRNESRQYGALVVEVVPLDQEGISRPKVGDHVAITGPYVIDKLHGWMEIHPVWGVELIPLHPA
jgi:hypothetical protein